MDFFYCLRAMFNTFRHHEHVVRAKDDVAVTEFDRQFTANHHEQLIGVGVGMPDKLSVQLDYLDVIVIDACQAVRLPVLRNSRKGSRQSAR